MPKHTTTRLRARYASAKMHIVALSIISILSSFSLGIRTAGEVETVANISALELSRTGDINGDGTMDARDAIVILEQLQSAAEPTIEQLLADPDQNGIFTIEDALHILREIAPRS